MARMIFTAVLGVLVLGGVGAFAGAETPSDPGRLAELVDARDVDTLRELGPGILPELARLYESLEEPADRQRVAGIWYQLGWESDDAVRVLMADVESDGTDESLRITAQYALGRVSKDPVVVEVLLRNMREGGTYLVRDKAACALAYDQVHLDESHKVALFRGLVRALADPKPEIQGFAIQALQIHTGQVRGFHPIFPEEKRREAIVRWEAWLADYEEAVR